MLQVSKNIFEVWFYTYFCLFLYMYIAPGQGQTTPWGQTFDVNRKPLSLRPFVVSLKKKSLWILILYTYWTNYDGPTSPQCYIPSHKVIGLLVLEKIFEGFLPYMGVAAIFAMWPRPRKQTFVPTSHWCSIWNLALIGQSVLEKVFENGGRRTDNGPWLYYKLTNEPKGSGELKFRPVVSKEMQ